MSATSWAVCGRGAALSLLAAWGAACGVLDAVPGGVAGRCQGLADKLALCPSLFGDGVEESFLAGPGPPRATSAPPADLSRDVQACVYRVSGSSSACQSAFATLVGCIPAPTCDELAASCAAPLAETKTACHALVHGD